LLEYGLSVNEKRCNPPLSEAEVRTIANSVGSYEVKERGVLEFNGVVQNQGPVAPVVAAPQEIVPADVRIIPYPEFPRWIMKGTSIYEGLVKPTCDVNTRFPEFMFVPAMTLVLNYLAMKVTVVGKKVKPGIFMVSIGRKGRVIKSGSVEDAIDYLRTAGILGYASSATKNAEAKSLIWQAGSPEGLGKQMARTNCKNAVLFYDELGTLTSKAKIEGSSFGESLCQVYESGMFSNTIKAERDNYTFEPNSYCISIIACCTDKKFASKMGPIVASSNGMDERFFYLYQPEVLPDMQPYKYVNCSMAAAETKRLIDKAVMKGVYHFADEYQPKLNALSAINNRLEHRAEKWALFFAVDLGRDEIDDECVERAEALCKYEQAAKEYLSVPETTTFEGQLQSEIIGLLQRGGGKVTMRQLGNSMKPEKHGTTVWKKVFNGLIDNGWTKETGTGKTGDPKSLVLMRNPDNDDD